VVQQSQKEMKERGQAPFLTVRYSNEPPTDLRFFILQ
jgi:hypothetical protein